VYEAIAKGYKFLERGVGKKLKDKTCRFIPKKVGGNPEVWLGLVGRYQANSWEKKSNRGEK